MDLDARGACFLTMNTASVALESALASSRSHWSARRGHLGQREGGDVRGVGSPRLGSQSRWARESADGAGAAGRWGATRRGECLLTMKTASVARGEHGSTYKYFSFKNAHENCKTQLQHLCSEFRCQKNACSRVRPASKNYSPEMWSAFKEGSYLRRIDCCITQL